MMLMQRCWTARRTPSCFQTFQSPRHQARLVTKRKPFLAKWLSSTHLCFQWKKPISEHGTSPMLPFSHFFCSHFGCSLITKGPNLQRKESPSCFGRVSPSFSKRRKDDCRSPFGILRSGTPRKRWRGFSHNSEAGSDLVFDFEKLSGA